MIVRIAIFAFVTCVLSLIAGSGSAQSPSPVGKLFRVPVHGDAGTTKIDVWLSLPAGRSRVPSMLLMHSSGGLHARDWENARALNKAGIATAVVDSFGPRSLHNVWQKKQSFTAWQMAGDGFAVLRWLQGNSRISQRRFGAMGRSLGGEATIYLALAKARRLRRDARNLPNLALAVPIYPGCIGQWRDAALTSNTRMHFFLAANDDITPAAHCAEYAQRMRRLGGSVAVFTFPDAYHSFDTIGRAVFSHRQENYSKCRNEWRDPNNHVRLDTGAQIAGRIRLARYLSECKTMGGWVGGNPRAAVELNRRLVDLAVSRLLRQ